MADVYVEVGAIKGVPDKFLKSAQTAMRSAIVTAVTRIGSGMTTVIPIDFKGIQVNVIVTKLVQDGTNVHCVLIGELFELPSKQRFNPGGSVRGEGKVAGHIDTVAGACVGAAVSDLMAKVGPAIAGSQAAPANTGTAGSKSPLIYIAPFDVAYATDPKSTLAAQTVTAITAMMDKKIKANTKRFTQDSKAFRIGSGMPAYVIGITAEAVVFDAAAKEIVATTKGYVAEHPSGSIQLPGALGRARQPGMTRPPRDSEKVELFVHAAESGTEAAIKWILQKHP